MAKLYDGVKQKVWQEELEQYRFDNRRHLYAAWSLFGTPSAMLDVGCGLGDLVTISRGMGVEAYGVDQMVDDEYEKGWFFHADLRQPFSLKSHVDVSLVNWVLCWEVGEHIPDVGNLCDTLCNHLKRDDDSLLIFTSAYPGQGGTEHVATRPSHFWHEQFHDRGLNFRQEDTQRLRIMWLTLQSPMFWLPANLMIFKR